MVITFARKFMKSHPDKGGKTYFVEQMIQWYWEQHKPKAFDYVELLVMLNDEKFTLGQLAEFYNSLERTWHHKWKGHTIRAGHRWKVGDIFSPVVWIQKPYRSPQIQFLPNLEVKKICHFEIKDHDIFVDSQRVPASEVPFIANNDGLSFTQFMHWFGYPKPFDGQIICWNKEIEYEYNES